MTKANQDYFVIALVCDNSVKYYAVDHDSGYPYWTELLITSKFFLSSSQAALQISDEIPEVVGMTPTNRYGSGPSQMAYSGLNLSDTNPHGEGTIYIMKVELREVSSYEFEADIHKPSLREQALAKLTAAERKALGV